MGKPSPTVQRFAALFGILMLESIVLPLLFVPGGIAYLETMFLLLLGPFAPLMFMPGWIDSTPSVVLIGAAWCYACGCLAHWYATTKPPRDRRVFTGAVVGVPIWLALGWFWLLFLAAASA